ncbi:hypothetical protein BK816_05970 [Boudabousia tangfeifanii]|uniref:Ribosome maturation factor RimP n=1 Tax=Boudabousia tangfeifanii TaxID=1912795 RepID=A0A1D9MKT2_9ACTO|nr:hypothetical protein [Boudabousia tangfeifanii]AOZ72895.1 hypothetical protein BK816_05970 [Boudabousia tangfeifanii]
MKKDLAQLRAELSQTVEPFGLVIEKLVPPSKGNQSLVIDLDLPDGPGQVSSDQLEEASRALSAKLDEIDPFPNAYLLEVGTVGAVRDLKTPRDWRRAVGLSVKIRRQGAGNVTGELLEVTDEQVSLRVKDDEIVVPLEAIVSARTRVDFSAVEE